MLTGGAQKSLVACDTAAPENLLDAPGSIRLHEKTIMIILAQPSKDHADDVGLRGDLTATRHFGDRTSEIEYCLYVGRPAPKDMSA